MKNKNLLITGGATRVGREIALHFAERGWNIALHYYKSSSKAQNLKKIIEQNLVNVALIKADLKNAKQVEKIIPLAKKQLGTIDCLLLFIVGPGAIPLTFILGANLMAIVFVNVYKALLLRVYDMKIGVSLNIL